MKMRKLLLSTLGAVALIAGANAALITNGDWESTGDTTWKSQDASSTQAQLDGWFSSAKDRSTDGAYVEAVTGYGTGLVAAMKTIENNYFEQTLAGVDAGIGQVTVNYDGGIRWHSSYSTAARNIHFRVSLWDATTGTELAGVDVVTAFSSSATSLNARSHVLSYDPTGLMGHSLAVRFENTTFANTGTTDKNDNTVLMDNIEIEAAVPSDTPPSIITQPQDATATVSGSHTFSVSASGSSPMAYQWMKDSVELSRETASSLLLSNLALADEGGYSVWVTNAFGSVTSTVATLTVVDDAADFDGDGLPNIWETDHGLDPYDDGSINPDNGASGDPDGDGLPNDEEFFMNSDPQVNESGQAWRARPEKARLMVVSAHPDDEGIFFGGVIPYYSQVRQLPMICVSMTSGDYGTRPPEVREAEFRNAVWAYGLRNQPVFPRFKDSGSAYSPELMDRMWDIWANGVDDGSTPEQIEAGKLKATTTLATYMRRYRPDVVATHDFDGEYGHPNHRGTASATSWAVDMAADPNVDLDGLPVWQVKKLYIHNYDPASPNETLPLFHEDWQNTSIDTNADGIADKTPIQVADIGLDFHASQGRPDVSTCYKDGENFGDYPCEWWGLASTIVGNDTVATDFTAPDADNQNTTYSGWARGDFFEHLTTFPDSDYDLLADGWETNHFVSLAAADPKADDDEDGHDNNYEFVAGLDPNTPDDIDMRIAAGQTVEFTLPAATGPGYEELTRQYQLLFSPDLADWTTVVAEGIADGTQVDYVVPIDLAKGFYRLVITLE